jgi:hypothetical protein
MITISDLNGGRRPLRKPWLFLDSWSCARPESEPDLEKLTTEPNDRKFPSDEFNWRANVRWSE